MKNIIKSTLFLLVVLFGCSKDSINNPDGLRLYKVSYKSLGGGDSAGTYTILYDIINRPVRIKHSRNNPDFEFWQLDIEYDSAGRCSGYTRDGDNYSFEYDQQGRIIRQYQKGIHTNGQTYLNGDYGYDNQGRLISDRWLQFQYDDSSNVTDVINNGVVTSRFIHQYAYNTSPNAWNKIGLQMYFVFNEPLMLSKNNPISSIYLSTINNEYSYEYYLSGYPKSVMIKEKFSPYPNPLRIEYEFR